MINSEPLVNPYSPAADDDAPFAGRKSALARLHVQLTDPANRIAVAFVGQRKSGKTALLRHFDAIFDDGTFVAAYVPVAQTALADETDWLLALAQSATEAVVQRGFGVSRLSALAPPGEDPRVWFTGDFLPEMMAIIRPHRRLVFLLDDAEALLDAIAGGRLPADSIAWLHSLLRQYRQIQITLTLDASYEGDVNQLQPLVRPADVQRLTRLSADDTAWLLQEPVADLYRVSDEVADTVYRLTGGQPALVQTVADAMFGWWESNGLMTISVDDVKAVTPSVARRAGPMFRDTWDRLSSAEHLVLNAISALLYDDPLRAIDTGAIETWLVETDFPMDLTAINAALRRLEYDEILTIQPPASIVLNSGLFQTWLLENARSPERAARATLPPSSAPPVQRRALWLAGLVMALLIGVMVLVGLSNAPEANAPSRPAPTVTLFGAE